MPFALALLASALLHAAALIGPAWELPGLHEPEPPAAIEAVLAKPVATVQVAAEVASVPKPPPKPAARPRVDRTRPAPAATTAAATEVAAASAAPAAPAAAVESPPPPVIPPVAVSPEPTISAPPPLPKSALPGKGRVRYSITRGEGGFVVGQAVHTWEHDGLSYKLQSVTETTGLAALFKPARVVQSSRGELSADGLKPLEFRHERVGGLDTANFDWARRIVAYGGREDSVTAGTQDMLSMYYQLVLLAPQSGVLEMPIATGRKLEIYRFEVLGEEAVALPGGERRAWRLRTKSGNDSIELWLSAGNGADARGLPLKIRFIDRKGEIFDQLAQDIDLRETQ